MVTPEWVFTASEKNFPIYYFIMTKIPVTRLMPKTSKNKRNTNL